MKVENSAGNVQNNPAKGRETYSATNAGGAKSAERVERGERAKETKAVEGKETSSKAANLSISEKGKEFARVKAAASEAPEVRDERIQELKAKIAAGTYKVDSEAVAGRLVDDHLKMIDVG